MRATVVRSAAVSEAQVTMQPVRADEVGRVAGTLAKAFHDDPVMSILFGGSVPADRAARFFSIMGRVQIRHELFFRTPGFEAAAIWAPPGEWKLPVSQIVRNTPGLMRTFGHRLFANLGVLGVLEKAHPDEPHYYLEFIGTDPAHQGKGLGSALIQPMIDRCDTEGVGAYLESSKESNVAFYNRFGFEVTKVITHKAGPQQWLMWRAAR